VSAVDSSEDLLRCLEETLVTLGDAQAQGLADVLADRMREAGIRYLLQIAIQACVDLGDRILAAEGLDEPARQRDVFPALAHAGILDQAIAQELADLVGLRNALAHHYSRVTTAEVAARVPTVMAATQVFARMAARWVRGA